jgi:hypothetical protein
VQSDDGQSLGVLNGTRTGLLATCAGLVADSLDIAAIDELFALLERNEKTIFPPSALTYNQLTGSTLVRYYPESGVLVNINGDTVSASGGIFGATPTVYGSVNELLVKQKALVDPVPSASLSVSGNMVYQVGNIPAVNRKFSLSREGQAMPGATDDATLTALVEQVLGNEVSGTNLYVYSDVTSSTNSLSFVVFISNETTITSRVVQRNYSLKFTYTRNTTL